MAVDEGRLMENVRARAQRLFDDGYHAEVADGNTVIVKNPSGILYAIDTLERTCTCPFFREWQGRLACKHLLGYVTLLKRQEAYEQLRIGKYGKFFAVWDENEVLVAVCVYKIGAQTVARRLSALALYQGLGAPAQLPSAPPAHPLAVP